ncbi:Chitinase A1 [Hypsizygus marmoreus]|uniref:Chitinase A1 n=1 Tax=Hypsizygus marmoreus TaxID=39966 RepID=A0A369JK67_HYPMA|nr:Chitinase A1 [Hypsizygus marmoreus]
MLSSAFLSLLLLVPRAQCAPAPHPAPSFGFSAHDHRSSGGQRGPLQATFAPGVSQASPNMVNQQPTPPLASGSKLSSPIAPEAAFSQSQGSSIAETPVQPLVMAYYPDWVEASFPPEKIDYCRFDWIDYAFAIPTKDFDLAWDSENSPNILRRLVAGARPCGTKVKLSIGGWTGSKHFSSAVATDDTRRRFVDNIVKVFTSFALHGVDIDWEYPGHEGAGGNHVSAADSENFVLFLRLLRDALPVGSSITAAAQTSPFTDGSGQPSKDVSPFAHILDWILIMNYDVWSSSPLPGPNAPMFDHCQNSTQPEANAVAAYDAWTKAGFPASKLVLGVPSYGYVSQSSASSLRQRADFGIRGNRMRSFESRSKVVGEDGGDGQVQFRALVEQGALLPPSAGSSSFDGANGFTREWDECSATPLLRSQSAHQLISYDDPTSLGMKATFAKKMGMLGVNMFDIHGDTDDWVLTSALRTALGLSNNRAG